MKLDKFDVQECWFHQIDHPHPYLEIAPLCLRIDSEANGGIVGGDHCHRDFFALYLILRGRGTHTIDGVPHEVARGDVYGMSLGRTHSYSGYAGLEADTVYFQRGILDAATRAALEEIGGLSSLFAADPSAGGGRLLHLPPEPFQALAAMTAEMRAEWATRTRSGAVVARGLFARLLVHLARHRSAPPLTDGGGDGRTVAAALRILESRFTEALRIDQVAASVFLSPDRFTKQFAAVMGRTPRDYLTYLRIERAKALLTEDLLPISEVGVRAGFLDAAYFARAFRAATGLSPSAFRRASLENAL